MTTMDYIIDRIKHFHINNMTLRMWKLNYDRVRKEFWQTLGAIAVVILLLFVCGDSDTETTAQAVAQTTEQTAQPDDFIEQACKEYEQETGRKIYPKGREFIRNGAIKKGLTTVNDVYILIVENSKFMWKDTIKITKQ
jgi:hypothetical protein